MKNTLFVLASLFALPSFAQDNSGCPDAGAVLKYAIPGLPDAFWRDNGQVQAPKTDAVLSASQNGHEQTISTKGGGLLFAQNAAPDAKTKIKLTYDDTGHLQKLALERKSFPLKRWYETIDYSWQNGSCILQRVVVQSPELGKTKGVTFDGKLCKRLDDKKLLDAKTVQTCDDLNRQLGEEIEKFSAELPDNEAFMLLTGSAGGNLKLKKYSAHDYPMTNAGIANNCLADWKPEGKPPTANGGVERGSPAQGGVAPAN